MLQNDIEYESHIAVRPATYSSVDFDTFVKIVHTAEWKASRFDVDYVDGMDGMWFLSCKCETLNAAKLRVKTALNALRNNGYSIERWKIEMTLLDSKLGDKEELLNV